MQRTFNPLNRERYPGGPPDSMPGRLTAGHRPLKASVVVRVHPRQPFLVPSGVPLHDNLGENYRDNLGESLSSARVCVGLATISADVWRRDEAQWHLGGRAEAVSGSGGKGQRVHNSLRFGRFRCKQPRCSGRCKIAADAPSLWRTILEQPEVEEFPPSCRRRWLHSYDLRDFTFGYEQWCHDGA